jgi:hypothetical protein
LTNSNTQLSGNSNKQLRKGYDEIHPSKQVLNHIFRFDAMYTAGMKKKLKSGLGLWDAILLAGHPKMAGCDHTGLVAATSKLIMKIRSRRWSGQSTPLGCLATLTKMHSSLLVGFSQAQKIEKQMK